MAWLHCEIIRFIDGTNDEAARKETEDFLAAALKSLKVEYVTRVKVRCPADEVIERLSNDVLTLARPRPQPRPTGVVVNTVNYIMENDLTLEMCQGINTIGINFKIEQNHDWSQCALYYRPGPLPIIDLHVLYDSAFGSPIEWAQRLVSESEGPAHVHVVLTKSHWLRIHRYYCRGDYRYLLWKRDSFRNPKTSQEAMQAGLAFRNLCFATWTNRKHEQDLIGLESPKLLLAAPKSDEGGSSRSPSPTCRAIASWRRRVSHLPSPILAFEHALADDAGAGRLDELLKTMSATPARSQAGG
jgi:hypothetical protein